MNKPKQVIVIRKDLKMRKGKIAAQAAHASMKVILGMTTLIHDPHSLQPAGMQLKFDEPTAAWLTDKFTKICVSVNSEEELDKVYQDAQDAGLHCAMIVDEGLTEFDGVPTKTCIAIGPNWSDDIDKITGELSLL